MIVICSWCKKNFRPKKPLKAQVIFKAKCKACLKKWNRIKKLSLSERAEMAMREAVRGIVIDRMRTGRPLIIWKDGKVVKADPHEVYRKHYQRKSR